MNILESIVTAVCLCADCFAVSTCSSTTLKTRPGATLITKVALAFGVIQAAFLVIGWAAGNLLFGVVNSWAHIIGGILLIYVGGSMLFEGLGNKAEAHDLNGWKNIILGGIATSIDALAVGGSKSMDGSGFADMLPLAVSVFIVTILSVVAGICFGNTLGRKIGKWAEIVGGAVLLGMGVAMIVADTSGTCLAISCIKD